MEKLICESCNGNRFKLTGNFYECEFCGSKYSVNNGNSVANKTLTDVKVVQYYLESDRFEASNNYTGSLNALTKALEVNPNSAFTMVKIGRCYRNLNLHAQAIQMYKNAIDIDPQYGVAYTNIGTISILNKNWAEAASYYEKGLPLINPTEDDYWTAYANYAVAVAHLGNPTRATQMIADAEAHGYANADTCRKMAGIQPKGGCYVATCVYGSYDCPQVWTLRRYRDETLAATRCGRAFIRTYYAISPTVVKLFGNQKWFRQLWKSRLDKMVNNLCSNGVESTPYQDKEWK